MDIKPNDIQILLHDISQFKHLRNIRNKNCTILLYRKLTLKDAHRVNFSSVPIEAEMWMVGGEMGHLKQPPPQEISNWEGESIASYDICYLAGSLVIIGEHESNVLRSSNLTVHQDVEVQLSW